jgi:hypothetical protein
MNIIFRNSRTDETIGTFEHPVVPRTGETVRLPGIPEAEVVGVDHDFDVIDSKVVVWLRPETGVGRQVMSELTAEGYI